MTSSDPGLIVVHYFRKLDQELLHENPSDENVQRFYAVVADLLRPYGIEPIFQTDSSVPITTKQIGEGFNDRWEVKVYELENDIVLLAKFSKRVRPELIEALRCQQDYNAYRNFFAEELSGILYDHVSNGAIQSAWSELIALSPSTQYTLIFDQPLPDQAECERYASAQGLVEPRFTGCEFSSIGNQSIYVARVAPRASHPGHRREVLWILYPDQEDSNNEFTRLCWSPYAMNSLPFFVRFLCDLTKCTSCHESAMVFKRKLESLQSLVLKGRTQSTAQDLHLSVKHVHATGLRQIQNDARKILVRSIGTDRDNITAHELEKLGHRLDGVLSGESYTEVNHLSPEFSRYVETFEIWSHDAMDLFDIDLKISSRMSFLRAEVSRLEACRLDIRSAIGYTRANMENLERTLRAIDSMLTTLSLRVAEKRSQVEERFANRFHFLEIFVVGFYTIYLGYMLHSWAGNDVRKAADIVRGFLLVTILLLVLVLHGSKKLFSLDALLIFVLVFLACVFAFLLNGCVEWGWDKTWRGFPYLFRFYQ
jgi:hypothetical protein